jgi:hypothetical protein
VQTLLLPILLAETQHCKRVGDKKKIIIAVERDIGVRDSCGVYLIFLRSCFSHTIIDSCETSLFWHVSKCMTCGTELCNPCLRDLAETSNSGVNPEAFKLPNAAVSRLATCVPHVKGPGRPVIHAAGELRPITRFRPAELQQAIEDLRKVETAPQVAAEARARADAKFDAMAEAKVAHMAESTAKAEAKAKAKAEAKAEIESAARDKARVKAKARASAKAKAKAEATGQSTLHADSTADSNSAANLDPTAEPGPGLDNPSALLEARLYQAPKKVLNRDAFTFHLSGNKSMPYAPFRKQWGEGRPIIIRNVQVRCSPQRILRESLQQNCSIVNCETSVERRGTLTKFFKHFDKVSNRVEKVKVRLIRLLPSSQFH